MRQMAYKKNENNVETPDRDQTPVQSISTDPNRILADIFRREALHHAQKSLGMPVRQLGVSAWILSFFFLALLAATLIFLFNTKYARKETVPGHVTPLEGSFRITSQYVGLVEKILVHEGQLVKAGQELIVVAANPVLEDGSSLADNLKVIQKTQREAQVRQETAKMKQLAQQMEEVATRQASIRLDLRRLGDARQLLERRLDLQLQNLAANRQLADKGMVSSAFLRQHEDAVLSIQQQIQESQREYELQKGRLAELVPQLGRLSADQDLARHTAVSLRAEMQEKELNSDSQFSRHLVAPVEGIVTALQIHPGAPVSQNQTLAVVVPSTGVAQAGTQLEVELWAPSKAIGFVKPGAKVRIMYDAFPYQTFGVGHGIVRDVSGSPVMPGDLPLPLDTKEQLFRIRIKLARMDLEAYGRNWTLYPGMRLSADLILEEESLIDWILGPLRAAARRAI